MEREVLKDIFTEKFLINIVESYIYEEKKSLYSTGKIKEHYTLRFDQRFGKYYKYYENGNPQIEANYIYNQLENTREIKDGEYIEYFKNGVKSKLYMMKDGKKNGPFKRFDVNGRLCEEGEYQNDCYHGIVTAYRLDGEMEEITFRRGKRHGIEKGWYRKDETGFRILKYKFLNKNGVKSGKFQQWYPNGRLKDDTYFRDGLENGVHTSWWPNGVTQFTTNILNGRYHGHFMEWYPSGMIAREGNHCFGALMGVVNIYAENGFGISVTY